MWRISERERTFLHNLLHSAAVARKAEKKDEDLPTGEENTLVMEEQGEGVKKEDLWETPIEFRKKNGELVLVSLKEVMKKDRLSCDELEAIRAALPQEVEFAKFVDCLQPHFIPLFPGEAFPSPPTELDRLEHQVRMEKLKQAAEEREYVKMTSNVDPSQSNGAEQNLLQDFGKELRLMDRELTAVLNTLITVGGAFAFGYFGIQLAAPNWGADVATCLLMGLLLATIVFFADLYFIVKHMDAAMDPLGGKKRASGSGGGGGGGDARKKESTREKKKEQ